MDCSAAEQQGIRNSTALLSTLSSASLGLTCVGPALAPTAAAAPALDVAANSCAADGASSTCDAVPAAGVRLCYCTPKWVAAGVGMLGKGLHLACMLPR